MRDTLRKGTALARTNRGALLLTLAVALVFVVSLADAENLAEFESRAMTRLFVLAALDTLVGSRLGARLVSSAHTKRSATEAPDPELSGGPARSTQREMSRCREARSSAAIARRRNHWPNATDRSGP